jgi:hypothetical protein
MQDGHPSGSQWRRAGKRNRLSNSVFDGEVLDLAEVIGPPGLVPPKCSDARVVPAGQWVRFDGACSHRPRGTCSAPPTMRWWFSSLSCGCSPEPRLTGMRSANCRAGFRRWSCCSTPSARHSTELGAAGRGTHNRADFRRRGADGLLGQRAGDRFGGRHQRARRGHGDDGIDLR